MSTPTSVSSGAPGAAAVRRPPVERPRTPRPALERPREGRLLGGVAAGVAVHLALPVRAVRAAFLISSLTGFAGVVLYGWLWAFVPETGRAAGLRVPDRGGPGGSPPGGSLTGGSLSGGSLSGGSLSGGGLSGGGVPRGPLPGFPVTGGPGRPLTEAAAEEVEEEVVATRTRVRADLLAGFFLIAAGVVLFAASQNWGVEPGLVLPLLIVTAGAVIAYAQFDEVDRARWFSRTGMGTRAATLRLVFGLLLVVLGVLLLVVQSGDFMLLGKTLLAAVAVLAGVGVVLAPWGVRMWRDLDAERAARVREAARADIAAHLHDSVLQTLALIQRRSHDGAEVVRLARAQERDLRGWLYGAADADPTTMAARVAALAAEAEDVHGAVVEVVTVGDRPGDDRTAALLAALREAVANAARHAQSPVRVYVESSPEGVEAFVRDRGPGFDLAAVGEDRLGVRESIIGRMERHGGSARVRSAPGEGTEVRLELSDREEEQ